MRALTRTAAPVVVTALLLAAAPAARAQAGDEDFHAILPAAGDTGYRGRKVIIDFTRLTPRVSTLTVLRQPGGRERRESAGSSGVYVVDGSASWQYLPERGIVVRRALKGRPECEVLRPEQVREAAASYEVRGAAAAPIAGRPSRLIEFLPRQGGSRPVRRVWIDVETGLILRSEISTPENRLSWLSVFESLEYGPPVDPEAFVMRVPSGVPVLEIGEDPCLGETDAERASGLPLVLPVYLPPGFARTCIYARRHREYAELQVLFSDGLSMLSLFESTRFREPGAGGGDAEAPVAVGPWPGRWYDLGLVTGIAWRPPWAHLALLGELSREELRKVAASVRLRGELSLPRDRP
jgi:outer membrane lipoprotein-sorting protein